MAALKTYLIGIVAAALAIAIVTALLREDALRKSVRLTGGLLLMLVVIGPIVRWDPGMFGQYLSELELRTDEIRSGIEVEDKEIMGTIIREKTEAYIWDKAAVLGADVTVSVTIAMDGAYPYPSAVEICGALTEAQRRALSQTIRMELAIPEERQVFTEP